MPVRNPANYNQRKNYNYNNTNWGSSLGMVSPGAYQPNLMQMQGNNNFIKSPFAVP